MIHKHFKTKAKFTEELGKGNVADSDICFIKDTAEIWTHGNYYGLSKEAATKLSGIASGAEVNVQSDWTETDTSLDSYIKNVPEWTRSDTKPSYEVSEIDGLQDEIDSMISEEELTNAEETFSEALNTLNTNVNNTLQECNDVLSSVQDAKESLESDIKTELSEATEEVNQVKTDVLDSLEDTEDTLAETWNDLESRKADKSTTLAGYGITDSYTTTQTDSLLDVVNKRLNSLEAGNSDLFYVTEWVEGQSSPEPVSSYGNPEFLKTDINFYLLDTTDNTGTTTKPVGKLQRNNLLRFQSGEFAPTVGVKYKKDCTSGTYIESDPIDDTVFTCTDGIWTNLVDLYYDGSLKYSIGEYSAEDWLSYCKDHSTFYTDSEGNTVISYDLTLMTSASSGEVLHAPRPWETLETKYTIGIGFGHKVYLLDHVTGTSGKMWSGIFKGITEWDGIDVSQYPLEPTAIAPCPSCVLGGKTRNFFYLYQGQTYCNGHLGNTTTTDGTDSYQVGAFYKYRTWPRTQDAQQVNNMGWGRANNSVSTSPVPFSEGGYHALNTMTSAMELLYGTRYLHKDSLFGSGISSNDSCSNDIQLRFHGGLRYTSDSGTSYYGTWGSNIPGYATASTTSRDNNSLFTNYYCPKEQCMESQMVYSYMIEMGVPESYCDSNGTYTKINRCNFYGSPYWYTNITTSIMSARIYKEVSWETGLYMTQGSSDSWTHLNVLGVLRMSLIGGMNLAGDIFAYWGGGAEIVGINDGNRTGETVTLYLQPQQSKWSRITAIQATSGSTFGFEDSYLNLGTSCNYSDSWMKTRHSMMPWKTSNGGSAGTYECAYAWDYNYWDYDSNNIGRQTRLAIRFRGHANASACCPRALLVRFACSAPYYDAGCSSQARIAEQ